MIAKKADNPLLKKVEELEAQLEQSLQDLETRDQEIAKLNEAQLRLNADLQNQVRRQTTTQVQFAQKQLSRFVENLLPSFRELQIGAQHSADKDLQVVVTKFFQGLAENGLTQIRPEPETPINPEAHEVLLQAEGKPGCIVECLEPGWQYQENVLQPAKVSGAMM